MMIEDRGLTVILLGPPGVGKGTQGALLGDSFGWERVVTGDLLRAARREGTELGKKAQVSMDEGDLVPDHLMVALVKERLERLPADRGVILDGFPRTVEQAEALAEALPTVGRSVDAVLLLKADDEVLVKASVDEGAAPSADGCTTCTSTCPSQRVSATSAAPDSITARTTPATRCVTGSRYTVS